MSTNTQDSLEVSLHPLVNQDLNHMAKTQLWGITYHENLNGSEALVFSKLAFPYRQDKAGLLFVGIDVYVWLLDGSPIGVRVFIYEESEDGTAGICEDPYLLGQAWPDALHMAKFVCMNLKISYHRIFERQDQNQEPEAPGGQPA